MEYFVFIEIIVQAPNVVSTFLKKNILSHFQWIEKRCHMQPTNMWIHGIMAKHHKQRSHLHSSLINANAVFPMVCNASWDYAMHSYPSTQQITNLIKNEMATGVTSTYNTTNATNTLYLINLHAMLHIIELPKLPCFSAVLLYTQLPVVLYPNNSHIDFIPITSSFPTHIPSMLYN